MVKTVQLPFEEEFGISYEIVPVTNDTVFNQKTCFFQNGTNTTRISLQPVLPFVYNSDHAFSVYKI